MDLAFASRDIFFFLFALHIGHLMEPTCNSS